MKDKPPPGAVKRFDGLMRGLLAVPKKELEEQERKWKKRRSRPKSERQAKT